MKCLGHSLYTKPSYCTVVAVKNSLIDGLRPMDVGGVQLEFVERGGGCCVVVVVIVVVIVGLCSAAAATVSVHVKVVVGQHQLGGIEHHVVDLLRSGDVGRHSPVGRDKVHRPVVVHADRRVALVARRVRRRRRGRQLCVVIHVLYRVHQIQRFRAVLGLDGGVLHLLPGVVVIADAVATLLHLEALLLLLVIVVMVHRVMVVDGLVVLPTDAAVVAAALTRALVYGAAAQIQHGRRRTLVVSRRSVLSRWPLIDPLQLKHVFAVGGGGGRLLTVDSRRRLRPGHEPEVSGRHVLNDRRRWFGLKLLQNVIVLQPSRRRPVLMVVMLIVFTAATTAAVIVVVVVTMVVMMVVVLARVRGLLMLEHGGRGFWARCRQAAVVANAIVRKTRAAGVYKVIK